jgi:hypothetical protein
MKTSSNLPVTLQIKDQNEMFITRVWFRLQYLTSVRINPVFCLFENEFKSEFKLRNKLRNSFIWLVQCNNWS